VNVCRMIRTLTFLAMGVLCASCRTDSSSAPMPRESPISISEFNDREDCPNREVARLLGPQGTAPTSLHEIAFRAANFCNEAIRTKLLKSAPSRRDGQTLATDDQLKVEHRAFAIGLELRDKENTLQTAHTGLH
jgi:hypothetical protein